MARLASELDAALKANAGVVDLGAERARRGGKSVFGEAAASKMLVQPSPPAVPGTSAENQVNVTLVELIAHFGVGPVWRGSHFSFSFSWAFSWCPNC